MVVSCGVEIWGGLAFSNNEGLTEELLRYEQSTHGLTKSLQS